MNERITLEKDSVIIDKGNCGEFINVHASHWNSVSKIVIHAGGDVVLDAGRLDALLDILHCWKDTGSFAALADTSDIPFVGKTLKRTMLDGSQQECTILERNPGQDSWLVRGPSTAVSSSSKFLPLAPPAPKVRPYTKPEQALWLIGKRASGKCNDADILFVGEKSVIAKSLTRVEIDYEELAKATCEGKPCGIIES